MGSEPCLPSTGGAAPLSVEAVSDAADRLQVLRFLRVDLDLGADLLDEIVDRARGAVMVRAPDADEDVLAGQCGPSRLDEAEEQIELRGGHLHGRAGARDRAG